MSNFLEELHKAKMTFVANTVKAAIANHEAPLQKVAKELGVHPQTAGRLVKLCKAEGYLPDENLRNLQNPSVIRLAEELGLDAQVVFEAVLNVGGRVTASRARAKD